jgi:hypothetical protein
MSVACVQLLARATREQSGKTIRCAQQCRFRGRADGSRDRSPCDIFMQVKGHGHCIGAQKLREALDQSMTLLRCLLLYAHAFGIQANYTALANDVAPVSQGLESWYQLWRPMMASQTEPCRQY